MKIKKIYYGLKRKNEDSIILIKNGNFYKTYEEDAIILYFVFGYQIKGNTLGFPINIFMKIFMKLNALGLNIIVYVLWNTI